MLSSLWWAQLMSRFLAVLLFQPLVCAHLPPPAQVGLPRLKRLPGLVITHGGVTHLQEDLAGEVRTQGAMFEVSAVPAAVVKLTDSDTGLLSPEGFPINVSTPLALLAEQL